MKPPETLESSLIVDELITVRKDRLCYQGEHIRDYFVVTSTPESVSVVAISPEGQILVTREYRHAIGKCVVGFAGGLVDPGENVLDAARRELLEETGCTAESFEVLGRCYPLPGILNQKMTIVLARGARLSDSARQEVTESIQSSFMTKTDLKALLQSDADIDGILCTALHFYSLSL